MADIPADRRAELLKRREALQRDIKVKGEIDKIRFDREKLDARGVKYQLVHALQPEYDELFRWYYASFPGREADYPIPDWSKTAGSLPGPWDYDTHAVTEWIGHVLHERNLGHAPIYCVHSGGWPHIVVSLDDLLENFDILFHGIEMLIACPEENWVFGYVANERWGFATGRTS